VAVPTDPAAWLQLVRDSMPPFWRVLAEGTGGGVWESHGVSAAIVPGSPKRSFFNSVLYADPAPLIDSIDGLAAAYADAGIEAWTVWVPEGDTEVAEALEAAGHRLDATPRAMAIELSGLRLPDPDPELEIRMDMDMELLRVINETAYGFPEGDFPPMTEMPDTAGYLASLNGTTVGTTLAWDRGEDVEITFVATLPEARGRGIAGRLLGHALERERNRGKSASTLVATKLGYPVYEKLGYQYVGGLEMWERRKPA